MKVQRNGWVGGDVSGGLRRGLGARGSRLLTNDEGAIS